jgi:hypothetical protein
VVAACRSAGPVSPASGLPAPAAAAAGATTEPAAPGLRPEDLGVQKLYRVRVRRDGEERSGLRLVLRLWTPRRFELAASDPLGRPLWRLVVADGRGFRGGPEAGETCRFDPGRAFVWPGIGRLLPASDLPAVLLGRRPAAPPESAAAGRDGGVPRWTEQSDRGGLSGWTLQDGAVRLEWRREEDGGDLRLAPRGIEIRWREVAGEPVAGTLPALPAGAERAPECAVEELP